MVPPTSRLRVSLEPEIPVRPTSSVRSHPFQSTVLEILESAYPALQEDFQNLRQLLVSGNARNLSEGLEQLAPTQRRSIETALGHPMSSWLSLATEGDARIFWDGVFQIARSLEERGELEAAAGVLAGIVAAEGNSPHPPLILRGGERSREEVPPLRIRGGQEGLSFVPIYIREQAHQHLDSILGRGPLTTTRLGNLFRRTVVQATDPSMVAGFAISSGVANVVRSATALGLGLRGVTPWAARLFSGSAAFFAEVPAFVGAMRLLRSWGGPSPALRAPSPPRGEGHTILFGSVGEELLSAGIFLGALRFTGGITELGVSGLAASSATRMVVPTLTTLGGIYLGHRMGEFFHLHPERDEANRWVEAVDTFLQLRVGGRLAEGVFGRSPHPYPSPPGGEGHTLLNLNSFFRDESEAYPSPLGGEGVRLRRTGEGLRLAASGEGRAPRDTLPDIPLPHAELHLEFLRQQLGPLATEEIQGLARTLGRRLSEPEKFAVMLAGTQIKGAETLRIGLHRLNHLVAHTRSFTAGGNYFNWLTRHAMEELMREPHPGRLDEILGYLHRGGDLAGYEQLLAPILPGYRLLDLPRYGRYLLRDIPSTQRIAFLSLSQPARHVLHRFLQLNQTRDGFDPFTVRASEFLHAFAQAIHYRPEFQSSIDRALTESPTSPLGALRVYRLFRILAEEPYHLTKIHELADPRLRLHGYAERLRSPISVDEILHSQADAHFGDAELALYLGEFHRRLPDLLDSSQVRQRRVTRARVLNEIWPRPRPLTNQDMLLALERLGDPLSTEIVREVREGRFRLLILEDQPFNDLAFQGTGTRRGERWRGFYVPNLEWEGQRADTLVVRQLQGMSTEPFHEAAFFRLATVVHEYEHHRHARPGVPRTLTEALRQEMLSHQREFHWLAEHGHIGWASSFVEDASTGWAMHLRDKIEGWYLVRRGEE